MPSPYLPPTTPLTASRNPPRTLPRTPQEARHFDNGRGIITGDKEEPLYGRTFLPKKFKIAVTVPGDNSVDIYINDIGLVVILEADGRTLKGYNVLVGGGMGRTNNKESTFARVRRAPALRLQRPPRYRSGGGSRCYQIQQRYAHCIFQTSTA
jgi:hypothetical protein